MMRANHDNQPPGPRGLPLVGVLPWLLRDPYNLAHRCVERFGDVCRLPIPGIRLTLVSHPDHIAHILSRNADNYRKGAMFRRLEPAIGNALPISEGDTWRSHRRLMNPMFGHRQLTELVPVMSDAVTKRVAGWERWAGTGEVVDLSPRLGQVTMSLLLRSMFGGGVNDDEIDRAVDDFRHVGRYLGARMMTVGLPNSFPVPYQRSGRAALARVERLIARMLADRRGSSTSGTDLLGCLLDARFEDGSSFTESELRGQIISLLFAGFETTQSALGWTIAWLDAHPDVAESLFDEIDGLGGRAPTAADLASLAWTKACFDEAQRLQGLPLFPREAIDDDEIGGYRIPAGSLVAFSSFVLHRDPRFWHDPDRYDPSRFLEDEIDRFAFVPFGGGPRHCIGSNLAYLEAELVLVAAFQRYRFRMAPGFVRRHDFKLTTSLKGGCPVTIHPRRARSTSPGVR